MDRSISSEFNVRHTYRLVFTRGVFDRANALLADTVGQYRPGKRVKLLFVLDGGLAHHHPGIPEQVEAYCRAYSERLQFTGLLQVPGGEVAKNDPVHAERVLERINQQGICRHSVVVAIGGGAVIDMAGYAAAIAHRGVQIIRIPTTVLAQNDAAVGVKNGLNHFGKKNFIGTFAVPLAIINDSQFLNSLEDRDWVAGMAEAVKVALIKDASFFEFLESASNALANRDMDAMEELIYRCARLHMEHIAGGGDPFERGSARPLDFGHWAAHKLEYLTGFQLRHGEAVAIGMALDVCYARNIGLLDRSRQDRILRLLQNLGFRDVLDAHREVSAEQLLQGIEEFREHLGGTLCITLLKEIGQKVEVHEIDRREMRRAFDTIFRKTAEKRLR